MLEDVNRPAVIADGAVTDHPRVVGGCRLTSPAVRGLPARTSAAVRLGRAAAAVSRAAGLGQGATIGGRLTLGLAPKALRHLTVGRTVVLVSGTNGKTTTCGLLTSMLRSRYPVVSNQEGSNMPGGLVAALTRDLAAPVVVLEVDEAYLPAVIAATEPACVVLLNLTRDQLDRAGEVRHLESAIRAALAAHAGSLVVANVDDPFVVSAAADLPAVRWVSPGARWLHDATGCPRCGATINAERPDWSCVCGLARPLAGWAVDDALLRAPDGVVTGLTSALPGQVNRGNAAMAAVTADALGVPLADAVNVAQPTSINGRYAITRRGCHDVRLLLAKNPAGWRETLTILRSPNSTPLVIAINAREADGRDTSWLWDVPFEELAGRTVMVSGDRAADLATRLRYAEVDHTLISDIGSAVDCVAAGPVDLIANYTAFLAARRTLLHES